MALTSGGLVKRSASFDADVLAWLEARGERIDRSVDWQMREATRQYMDRVRAEEGAPR